MVTSMVSKLHQRLGGGIIGISAIFFAITGILLNHRDDIRNLNKVGRLTPQKYTLDYSQAVVSINKAVGLAQQSFGKQSSPKRIEMRYDRGTLIYRLRFGEEGKGETEVTIDALTGRIIIPAYQLEFKEIAEKLHNLEFLNTLGIWLIDILGIGIIFAAVSVLILHFKLILINAPCKVRLCKLGLCKFHRWLWVIVALPVLISTSTGIALNHQDFLKKIESSISHYEAKVKTKKPDADFSYDSLPITVKNAIDIAQVQFPKKKELRRVILSYEYATLVYNAEFQEGMRQGMVIDAYTGDIIKPYHAFELIKFTKPLHYLWIFGKPSVYFSDMIALIWIIATIINLWCPVKRRCLRMVFCML